MEGHVLPVASHIDWHLDAIEQRKQISVLPPGITKRMFSGNGTPEIVPRVGIMVQVEQNLKTGDRSFPVCGLELLVDGGGEEECTHGLHQFAAPELVGMPGCHSNHVEERSEKVAAQQSMMGRRLIEVKCPSNGHDGFQMRRS